jgi:5-methylcytosine-specific restriction protein A
MDERFDWVPFFKEMAGKLLTLRDSQPYLVSVLKEANINGLTDENPKGVKIPLKEIDPFTFTSMICKHHTAGRIRVLEIIKKKLQISRRVPKHFDGIPNVDPRQAWLFPFKYGRNSDDVAKLWNLYEEVVNKGKITESTFSDAQNVRCAGKAKLTQAMFRAAPDKFLPVDGQTRSYLARFGLPNSFSSASEYEYICAQAKEEIGKPIYEQSFDAWYFNQNTDTEGQYQKAALNGAKSGKNGKFEEPPGGLPVPPKSSGGTPSGYRRNPAVGAEAMRQSKFKCEIDTNHKTFVSNSSSESYVEAHHLIPISKQWAFDVSLDVTANIVALCPTCHRFLHHGKASDKKNHLGRLLNQRKKRLAEKGINLDIKKLLAYYHGDLLEEEA